MSLSEIIYVAAFYLFALLTVASAFVVAGSRNIVHSAFALLATFFGVAGLYVFLGADFLAGAQVLIYVGGILVLILFAIMLTHRISDANLSNLSTPGPVAFVVAVLIGYSLIWVALGTAWKLDPPPAMVATTADIGRTLMTKYIVAFEVASVLLLAALIGAAFLARKETKAPPAPKGKDPLEGQ